MRKRVLSVFGSSGQGGTELRAFQVATRLRDHFDMAALFLSRPGPIQHLYQRERIPFWTIPFTRLGAALKTIRRCHPDVIHLYGLEVNVIWRPLLYLAGYRHLIGHIAGLSNTGEEPGAWRIVPDRLTVRFLKLYVVNSAKVADRLVDYGFARERLRVINNGVMLPPAPTRTGPHSRPVIISVGNLRSVKGYSFLISSLHELTKRGIDFEARLVGDGPERESLIAQTRSLGISDRVQFVGTIENEKLHALLESANLFALLSLSEGISGAAMEAMSAGLPIVATDVGGMSELVSNGKEGFLVEPRNPAQAADRLEILLRDPALRLTMGVQARGKIESHFNLERVIRDYTQLYSEQMGDLPQPSTKPTINSV